MSQFDVAFLLLLAGLGVGWRLKVYAMIPLAMLAVVCLLIYSRYSGDGVVVGVIHAVEGLVIFEVAYLFGAMLADARRSVPVPRALRMPSEHLE
jgi:hypothetical protein